MLILIRKNGQRVAICRSKKKRPKLTLVKK
jgi:hypothetical protein